jgi:hypothetical protein
MATQVQYPASQVLTGGQPTAAANFAVLSGYEVISATPGYLKDEENKQNSTGTHRCRIQYSKRKTWSLELEAHSGTDITEITDADELTDIAAAKWDIISAVPTHTRGVTVLKVELVAQTDSIS